CGLPAEAQMLANPPVQLDLHALTASGPRVHEAIEAILPVHVQLDVLPVAKERGDRNGQRPIKALQLGARLIIPEGIGIEASAYINRATDAAGRKAGIDAANAKALGRLCVDQAVFGRLE